MPKTQHSIELLSISCNKKTPAVQKEKGKSVKPPVATPQTSRRSYVLPDLILRLFSCQIPAEIFSSIKKTACGAEGGGSLVKLPRAKAADGRRSFLFIIWHSITSAYSCQPPFSGFIQTVPDISLSLRKGFKSALKGRKDELYSIYI